MCEAHEVTGLSFTDLEIGHIFSWERIFTLQETLVFCNVSGDHNRIHTNDDFAKAHGFLGGAVVHGVRSLTEVSRACGDRFFVPGVVCLNLEAEFKRAVYHDKPHVFSLRVLELISGRKKETLMSFLVSSQEGKVCVSGKVRLMFP